jgi:hypothetical protein
MTFTGNLIEGLMATVERAERRARASTGVSAIDMARVQPLAVEPLFVEATPVEPMLTEPWFALVQETSDYDSKFMGVA